MSWKVTGAAKRINWVTGDNGEVRKMRASEKSVLKELADEARGQGARGEEPPYEAQMGAGAIARACSLSVRAVRYALKVLARSGHISRRVTTNGMAAITAVHPRTQAPAGPLFGDAPMASDAVVLSSSSTGPVTATAPAEAPPPPQGPDEVAQVYDAWNQMATSAGLPGPVNADAARDVAVARALTEHKLWRVLMAIRRIPESNWLLGKRHDGQGDWLATFDWVFRVERYAGLRNLKKLLEGNYHGGTPVPTEPPAEIDRPAPVAAAAPVADDLAPFVSAVRDKIGDRLFDVWLAGVVWHRDGDRLTGDAPSAFVAERIAGDYDGMLRSCAMRVLGIANVAVCHRALVPA